LPTVGLAGAATGTLDEAAATRAATFSFFSALVFLPSFLSFTFFSAFLASLAFFLSVSFSNLATFFASLAAAFQSISLSFLSLQKLHRFFLKGFQQFQLISFFVVDFINLILKYMEMILRPGSKRRCKGLICYFSNNLQLPFIKS
jgi:hypothetical protein